jgi:hypothetical protein
MSARIWKFSLLVTDFQTITMPRGAVILDVQVQHGGPQLWAQVDPDAMREARVFRMYGTGNYMPDGDPGRYIGTFQIADGDLVFHVYEEQQ